ncbi:MAG: carboxypeptidase regulatory-like domain-containing protein, partial [Blastocatellia bacterium]
MKKFFVRGCVFAVSLIVFSLLHASAANAQTLTGSITGQATDAQGAALAGVKVTVSSKALIGGTQTTATDASGSYTFKLLPPGGYDIKFEMQGFKAFSRTGIEINAAFVATVNATLEIGAMSETVTITGEAPVIDTKSNIQQTVLDQKLLENLPSGRDPWAVGRIVPGMQMGKFDVGGSNGMQQTGFTIHGSVANQSQYNIDGLTINWPGGNEGGSTALYYDQGMFQEVNYQTNALPAEVSVGGTYMNMVTKSGGNDFHGNVLFYYANENIQSDNFNKNSKFDRFRLIRPTLTGGNPLTRSYDFNGHVGGPVIKDRLWFFTSFRQWGVDKRVLGARNPDGSFAIDDNRIVNVVGKATWRMTENNTLSYMYNNNQKDRFHRRDTPPSFIED